MTGSSSTQALTSCAGCGIAFPLGARFCPSCGSALESSLRQTVAARRDSGSIADPLIGQVIAERYRILALLGRGGMGVVYRVEHVHIGKLMAMKLLAGELASDPQTLKRFQREAKAVSKLGHPNTVQIFDFGESAHLAYLVMEYLPGRDLATVIHDSGALPFERVARIALQIAASVEEAHQSGIIHRDIKPENVMLLDTPEQRDFVKVLDFGIAKLRDFEDGVQATQKGHLVGTPYYMAPEQIRGDAIDQRVDVYALGALMYKAISGETPFHADTLMEVLGKVLNDPLVPARKRAPERAIPPEADRIIAKALAKNPADRYPSMAALREELLRYLRSVGAELRADGALRKPAEEGFATRGDVDRYERGLRRTSRFGRSVALLAIAAASVATVVAWRLRRETAPLAAEVEPNDEPSQAHLLAPGKPVSALLGKRRSTTESDADVYRIELGSASARVADIRVSAIPNLDLVLELVEKGAAAPMLVADSAGVGEPERIPNVSLPASTYYVRVREPTAGVPGRPKYATENVSDPYEIRLTLSALPGLAERELNDQHERAERLEPGATRSGLIGWKKDRDVYCASATAAGHTVELSGVPGLDLVLNYLDRRTDAGQRVDRGGVGAGERIELPAAKSEREPCVTVSAREREGAAQAEPEQPYRISLSAR